MQINVRYIAVAVQDLEAASEKLIRAFNATAGKAIEGEQSRRMLVEIGCGTFYMLIQPRIPERAGLKYISIFVENSNVFEENYRKTGRTLENITEHSAWSRTEETGGILYEFTDIKSVT